MTLWNYLNKDVKDVGKDVKGLYTSIKDKVDNLSTSAKVGILAGTLAAIVSATDVKKAEALPFTNIPIGTNFLVSGNYDDTGAQLQIDYLGPPGNDGLYGNRINLNNVNFGGDMWKPGNWTINPNPPATNPDGSTNYQLFANNNLAKIRGPPFNFGFSYAPQNGFSVPDGIGSEELTFSMPLTIWDSNLPYSGFIPAPLPIANGPSQIPEPMTGLMLGTGLAGLAALRRYEK